MLAGVKYARSLATIPPFSDLFVDDGITPSGTSDEDLTRSVFLSLLYFFH